MPGLFVSAQLAAVVAVLVGVFLLLPLGGALVVDGVLVVALSTAAEVIRLRALRTPSDRRSGPNTAGGE